MNKPNEVTAPSGHVYYLQEDGSYKRTDENGKQWRMDFRIRKLTPRECFRLMGVSEEYIDKMMTTEIVPKKKGSSDMVERLKISKSQLYKLAGNSIVVNCLESIFRNMLIDTLPCDALPRDPLDPRQLLLFDFNEL